MSLILSRRDLDFVLFEWLAVEDLLSAPRYSEHDRETLVAVMDLAEKLAEQHFLPANRIADRDEPKLSNSGEVVLPVETAEALAAFAETGSRLRAPRSRDTVS
jgi:hypothetical protein